MERIQFVTHRGHRVLLVDATHCSADELAALADRTPSFVTAEPHGTLLLLADFTGCEFTRAAVERLKVAAVVDRAHLKRSAWVVSSNLPKALYSSIRTFSGRDIPLFETREEALDYLVNGAQAFRSA